MLTLRAENTTPYDYIPGYFGFQRGLYDLRYFILEESLPLTNGKYTWKVEPISGDGTFVGEGIDYSIRGDWDITGTPYQTGASTDYFHLMN
ncbi:hypothetical protein F5Y03DRAFT_352970 [Xylaria venustula]|nr:hypothetical protein F5Y03DRAFT_352970 [Xylaria venustula]